MTGSSRLAAGLRHHDAAEQHAEVGTVAPPAAAITSPMRDAHRNAQRNWGLHGAGYGEVFVGHRPVQADVDEGLNVGDHRVHVLGKSAGGDNAARDHVDENEFIACRVGIGQGHYPHSRRGLLLQRFNDLVILFLDSDRRLQARR